MTSSTLALRSEAQRCAEDALLIAGRIRHLQPHDYAPNTRQKGLIIETADDEIAINLWDDHHAQHRAIIDRYKENETIILQVYGYGRNPRYHPWKIYDVLDVRGTQRERLILDSSMARVSSKNIVHSFRELQENVNESTVLAGELHKQLETANRNGIIRGAVAVAGVLSSLALAGATGGQSLWGIAPSLGQLGISTNKDSIRRSINSNETKLIRLKRNIETVTQDHDDLCNRIRHANQILHQSRVCHYKPMARKEAYLLMKPQTLVEIAMADKAMKEITNRITREITEAIND
jgi:hypothetical protein